MPKTPNPEFNWLNYESEYDYRAPIGYDKKATIRYKKRKSKKTHKRNITQQRRTDSHISESFDKSFDVTCHLSYVF